ncbi:hypothetical protein BD289DRAFT_360202 [Coniella lustricola]|uniref:Tafazzin n=1 Tax=Coniella lustricola TaxID=2025994 RepID=A0A2T3AKJ4_9PEZI|nr:hypothetical protein BD289DRAFT_360202 [Coniella lustricola]
MPKKRHNARYSKPQSTAPASLSSSSARNHASRNDHERPSVNQLLASLRRTRLNGDTSQPSISVADLTAPSVPPQIRVILSLPETPAPSPVRRPRLLPRFDARGVRLPPGPPPPRSWLALSRHAPRLQTSGLASETCEQRRLLPALYTPGVGSLTDMLLRKIALDWAFQRSYNVYYLHVLPDRLRMALVSYVTVIHESGLSLSDLKLIFLPQAPENADDGERDDRDDNNDGGGYGPLPSPSSLNEAITHLDLSTSIGKSLNLRELSHLLFPSSSSSSLSKAHDSPVAESWDAADLPTVPRPLLPNLTHLSLAANSETRPLNSWKQLLGIAPHLRNLTHLSLAFWPLPTLTPNSTYSKLVTPQGQTVQAGGTNPYSHSLDDDWSEAILVLRKLSESMYGLEYLDLTGCTAWFTALTASRDGDRIDWVGAWGKISHLVLHTGYGSQRPEDGNCVGAASEGGRNGELMASVNTARRIEKDIRTRRAGRGRFITVERDQVET